MPYWHFPGMVKIIPSLLSREISYRYARTKFDKLILRKIFTIVDTRCHILKLKCSKFDFGWLCPRPRWGSLQRSPWLDLSGPTSKGRGRKDVREGQGRGEGRGRKLREGKNHTGTFSRYFEPLIVLNKTALMQQYSSW